MKPFKCVQKRWAHACLKILSLKCVKKIDIQYMSKQDLALNDLQSLICRKTKQNKRFNLSSVICLHTVKWLYKYDLKVNNLLVFLLKKKLKLICLHTVKSFQVLLSNTNNFI